MAFTLEFEEGSDLLRVVTKGEVCSYEEYLSRSESFLAKALDIGTRRILLDNRHFVFKVDAFDTKRMVHSIRENDVHLGGFRVAALCGPESYQDHKSNEAIFRNGSLSYKVFDAEEAALEWVRI